MNFIPHLNTPQLISSEKLKKKSHDISQFFSSPIEMPCEQNIRVDLSMNSHGGRKSIDAMIGMVNA